MQFSFNKETLEFNSIQFETGGSWYDIDPKLIPEKYRNSLNLEGKDFEDWIAFLQRAHFNLSKNNTSELTDTELQDTGILTQAGQLDATRLKKLFELSSRVTTSVPYTVVKDYLKSEIAIEDIISRQGTSFNTEEHFILIMCPPECRSGKQAATREQIAYICAWFQIPINESGGKTTPQTQEAWRTACKALGCIDFRGRLVEKRARDVSDYIWDRRDEDPNPDGLIAHFQRIDRSSLMADITQSLSKKAKQKKTRNKANKARKASKKNKKKK